LPGSCCPFLLLGENLAITFLSIECNWGDSA
jgi:hypothetical protein